MKRYTIALVVFLALVSPMLGAVDFSSTQNTGTLTIYRVGQPLEPDMVKTDVVINQDIIIEINKNEIISMTLDIGEYLVYFAERIGRTRAIRQRVYLVEVLPDQEVFVNVSSHGLFPGTLESVYREPPDTSTLQPIETVSRARF